MAPQDRYTRCEQTQSLMSPQAPGPPPPSSGTPLHADHPRRRPYRLAGMSEQQCRVNWWARTGSQPSHEERPTRCARCAAG